MRAKFIRTLTDEEVRKAGLDPNGPPKDSGDPEYWVTPVPGESDLFDFINKKSSIQ